MMVWKASMPGTAGYPEDEDCSMCRGEGKVWGVDCGRCNATGKRNYLQENRNRTLRDAAPVPQNDPNWDDFQPWEDQHGLTDEEHGHIQTNLAHTVGMDDYRQFEDEDWQQKNAGEPMEIAMRLLKTPLLPESINEVDVGGISGSQYYTADFEHPETGKIYPMQGYSGDDEAGTYIYPPGKKPMGGLSGGAIGSSYFGPNHDSPNTQEWIGAPVIPDREGSYEYPEGKSPPAGMGTAMYDLAAMMADKRGAKIVPSPSRSHQARQMWAKHEDKGHWPVKTGEPMDIALRLLKALPHQAINTDPYIAQHDIDRGNITHTPQYTIHPIAERLTHEAYEAKHGQAMPEWDNYHMGSIARVAPRRDEVGRIITIPASNGNPEMQVDENWWQDKLMRDETEPYRQFFDNMTPEDEEDMALFIGQQASGDSDYQLPSTDWQDKKTGEPMDIAWQLLKAAFFTPKSGYKEEDDYPKRAIKKPPPYRPGFQNLPLEQRRDFNRQHFFNRVGVAGSRQREANFRESLPNFPFYTEDEEGNPVTHSVLSNNTWPSWPGEKGEPSAGRHYWSGNKMRNLLIPPRQRPRRFSTEGTRPESNEETIARHREADKLIEQMGLTQRIPQEGAGARVEMRPGWQHGAGGRKEKTAIGDEAWDKMWLPKGLGDIQEGHEGPDDWWKTGEPIDWRGEGEA